MTVRIANPTVWREGWPEQMGWSQGKLIQRLEQWHRAWEIANPDKILWASFASEHDMNHDHVWTREELQLTGRALKVRWRCRRCLAFTYDDPTTEDEGNIMMIEVTVRKTPSEVARETEWERLIRMVNARQLTLADANQRFTHWVHATGNH